jgi:hypothetical protein
MPQPPVAGKICNARCRTTTQHNRGVRGCGHTTTGRSFLEQHVVFRPEPHEHASIPGLGLNVPQAYGCYHLGGVAEAWEVGR